MSEDLTVNWWYRSPAGVVYGPYDRDEVDRYVRDGRIEASGFLREGPEPEPWQMAESVIDELRAPVSQVDPPPDPAAADAGFESEFESRIPSNPPVTPPSSSQNEVSPTSKVAYILLGILPGVMASVFGVHNLVAGYTARGATQLTLSLVLIWGMACIGAVIGFTICLSILTYVGLLIWTIVEVCTVEVDGQGRRFRSG
ncbi:MAG: hypothetical protein CMJ54_03100 [Planctomycetaceae bacterium]|nr:hypothetical protein [Planctomycetaceae bacterium]